MKEIAIISGKGGTGKTVITASFAALAEKKVIADCDVDAADLHLLLHPEIKEQYEFKGGKSAIINQNRCIECGKCLEVCRFSAIKSPQSIGDPPKYYGGICARKSPQSVGDPPKYYGGIGASADSYGGGGSASGGDAVREKIFVDPISCEGCGFCSYVCPAGAITMEEDISGNYFISETRFGPFVHAKLGIAQENSGKLVSLVKEKARRLAQKRNYDLIIVDGSPGIGCPVIASLSGVDYAIVVTEPTLTGLHDLQRVLALAASFRINSQVIINKFDLNLDVSRDIERYCQKDNIDLLGKISFDESVVKAMVEEKTIVEYHHGKAKKEIIDIWCRFSPLLKI